MSGREGLGEAAGLGRAEFLCERLLELPILRGELGDLLLCGGQDDLGRGLVGGATAPGLLLGGGRRLGARDGGRALGLVGVGVLLEALQFHLGRIEGDASGAHLVAARPDAAIDPVDPLALERLAHPAARPALAGGCPRGGHAGRGAGLRAGRWRGLRRGGARLGLRLRGGGRGELRRGPWVAPYGSQPSEDGPRDALGRGGLRVPRALLVGEELRGRAKGLLDKPRREAKRCAATCGRHAAAVPLPATRCRFVLWVATICGALSLLATERGAAWEVVAARHELQQKVGLDHETPQLPTICRNLWPDVA